MTAAERADRVLAFDDPGSLPCIEWAGYWDQTVDRWRSEGLPPSCETAYDIALHFGLDPYLSFWTRPMDEGCPKAPHFGMPIIEDEAGYEAILPHLYPTPAFPPEMLRRAARARKEDGAIVAVWVDGFFWFPRVLLGIENHLYAFHDQPELLHRINADMLAFALRGLEEIMAWAKPQWVALGEDMSYNNGPMISREMMDTFCRPYTEQFAAACKRLGLPSFVDSDGLVDQPVSWYQDYGMEGFLPLEKKAGVDLVAYRQRYPRLRLCGGFDKTCMALGEAAMRSEFERLLPVMRSGGYIPGVDHQTPPDVSMENYRVYVRLLQEYTRRS